ncbi:E3 ubiquitin-protein ligase TRIM38-like [Sorex fumeus]|uniref:E3 ubiquitin-protein ligase TRIM38-like n=1 Tax=Sorex fumeus TaxID=62283 RepID=UPI0024AE7856|nr:E3 ubiquitin-protein ligase TRIM38-like [Sorex fumeus]
MASGALFKTMKEDATCSICLEIMTKPVSIDCGHSYCQSCIMKNVTSQQLYNKKTFYCPVCRSKFQKESIRPVKELENIISSIKKVEQETLCEEHRELLQLFCVDDQQIICWRCERTPQHKEHTIVLVEDVCQSYKDKFQEAVTKLKKLENQCNRWMLDTNEQKIKFKEKIELNINKIQSVFKKFYVILHEEEQVCLCQLEGMKEQTLRKLEDRESSLEMQSQKLKNHILELENKCQGLAQNLMQVRLFLVSAYSRISSVTLESPETVSLELPDLCKVSNIYVNMKTILETCHVSVTLDPDTAHRELILTENQKQVTRGCPERKTKIPSRFTVSPCVLGCETFTSGRHFFEVSVKNSIDWDVGVCLESVPMADRDDIERDPEYGFWAISRSRKMGGYVVLTLPVEFINSEMISWHIGVFLDCENRHVSFYNMNTRSRILTLQNANFPGPLKPYFRVGKGSILCGPPLEK